MVRVFGALWGAAPLSFRDGENEHAIAAAYEVDEVKDIRDKAVALQAYARQAKDTENERRACEIRLRAERKAGELLKKMEKAKGGGTGANQYRAAGGCSRPAANKDQSARQPTLNQLGITKDQSSDWQKLASIPAETFEKELTDPAHMPTAN